MPLIRNYKIAARNPAKMTTEDLVESVVDAAIEDLRQTSFIPFWRASIDVTPNEERSRLFRESRMADPQLRAILEAALGQRRFTTFWIRAWTWTSLT